MSCTTLASASDARTMHKYKTHCIRERVFVGGATSWANQQNSGPLEAKPYLYEVKQQLLSKLTARRAL